MSISKLFGVKISGIASAIPGQKKTGNDYLEMFSKDEIKKISKSIGVDTRYIASSDICTSDLCFFAAEKLFNEGKWEKESIDTLIFLSQTPDYKLPATSCVLQKRLNLSTDCACFDINMGCSGYIYGLWIASNLIFSGGAKRVLLLVGDSISKLTSVQDKSVSLLFGDAGTATLIEKSENIQPLTFVLGTDGGGADNLIVPGGGFRNPSNESTKTKKKGKDGITRNDEELFMNGAEIFAFTIKRVPHLIELIQNHSGYSIAQIDFFVFHQANKFMLNFLAKKMKLPSEKVPMTLDRFGNTSSASIPMTLSSVLAERIKKEKTNIILAGFGVGYSWGAVNLEIGPVIVPNIITV